MQQVACEAFVHVDVPPGGLQMLVRMGHMHVRLPAAAGSASAPAATAAQLTATATAAGGKDDERMASSAAASTSGSGPAVPGLGQGVGGHGGRGVGGGGGRGRGRAGRGGGQVGTDAVSSAITQLRQQQQGQEKQQAQQAPQHSPHESSGAAAKEQEPAVARAGASATAPAPDARPPQALPERATSLVVAPEPVPFGPRLQHLSPIRMAITLPAGYPSACAPQVTVSAPWLTHGSALALQRELLVQWETLAGPGCPVLYAWLDWVKSCSLGHLRITSCVTLGQEDGASEGTCGDANDTGSGSGACASQHTAWPAQHEQERQALPPEAIAMQLLRYAAARDYQLFCDANHRCNICFDDFLGSACVRLECGDHYCRGCITTHLRMKLGDGAVDKMACPTPGCKRPLPPSALQALLSGEEFARWEALLLQRTLDAMEDAVYCPRCQ